ncbi:hypothetical protein [Saccharothrix deserti]|uniref:hypothetical protein n=1 Tax=Saccharothrix deserti TaxID=2593674 RepID=UPI00131E88D3|nr:hypothetical protein [Saccharothrix deserti]
MDSAIEFRNRDSTCTVYIWDVDGAGNWYKYAHQPRNSSSWFYSLDRRNNGHSRCSEGAPINK